MSNQTTNHKVIDDSIGETDIRLKTFEIDARIEYISFILSKVKVIKFVQMVEMLRKRYDLTTSEATNLIRLGEFNFNFLWSTDNIIIDYEYYKQVMNDKFYDTVRLNNPEIKLPIPIYTCLNENDKELLKCLTVVANSAPYSDNFCLSNYPWNLMFVVEKIENGEQLPSILYQVTTLNENNINAKQMLIASNFNVEEEDRKYLKRVAVIDDESIVNQIRYLGFNFIIKIVEDKMVIVERRIDPWP